jgi:hypothetical protein
MTMVTHLSPTVYLDTALWIDLAEERRDRRGFERLVAARRFQVVLSYFHIQELALQEPASRARVSSYLDFIASLQPLLWIRSGVVLARRELDLALQRHFRISAGYSIESLVGTLPDSVADLFAGALPPEFSELSIRTMTEACANARMIPTVREYRVHFPERLVAERSRQVGRTPFSKKALFERIARRLPLTLRTREGIELQLTGRTLTDFLESIDVHSIPAVASQIALAEGWLRLPKPEQPSCVDDYGHVASVGYCDLAFLDARVCEALRTSKIPMARKPRRNGEFPRWLDAFD